MRKRVDLDDLIKGGLPVYVRNTTRPRGVVIITFTDSAGKRIPVKIRPSTLPTNLLDHVTPNTLATSDDLRVHLRKGILELIDAADAKTILEDPDNADELERMNLSKFSSRDTAIKNPESLKAGVLPENANVVGMNNATPDTHVSSKVLAMVERVTNNDLPIREAVAQLKGWSGDLSLEDLTYLIHEAPKGQLKGQAEKMLAELEGGSAPDDDEE